MPEYIEREALIKNLNTFAPEHYSALINMLITKQPTADVVPRSKYDRAINTLNAHGIKIEED